jgi:hypothetical protein
MAFMVNPDPDHRPTPGQRLDAALELDEQTFEAMGGQLEEHKQRIADLESRMAMVEALLVTGEVAA